MFGYTYPDVEGGRTPDSIRKRYDDSYGWQSQTRRGDPPENMKPLLVFKKAQVFRYNDTTKRELIAEWKKTGALDAVLKDSSTEDIVPITVNQPTLMQQTILSRSIGPEKPIVEDRILPKFASSSLVVTNTHDVNEEEVERTWYVDNIVER